MRQAIFLALMIFISGCIGQNDAGSGTSSNGGTGTGGSGLGGFCGFSTNGACASDNDCISSGCSGQVCQGASEEPLATTCEWQDCYDTQKFGVECGCIDGGCRWRK